MENRKFVKILFSILFGFVILGVKSVFAYDIDTHAFLTEEAVEFYSQKAATNAAKGLSDYLLDGSRKEDDIPRWMNHFYDPVYNRGLTHDSKIDPLLNLGAWSESKEWAVNSGTQNEIKYKVPTTIASILTAVQQRRISALTAETDFTWNQALYYWINGEKEKAMFALGHILHLIQDASVPDHTRNDAHPEGSIYEKWASQFTVNGPDNNLAVKLANKDLISSDSLSSYFDELAKYSNNNFYSKDTIGIQSGYNLPETENIEKNGDYYYGYKRDEFGNIYYISIYKNYRGSLVIEAANNISLKIEDEDKVVSDYWSLLSPKAVQYSASVMDFFFKEAERLKDDLKFAKRESFFAQVIDLAKGIISTITGAVRDNAQIQSQNLLAEVSLNEENNDDKNNSQGAEIKTKESEKVVEENKVNLEQIKKENTKNVEEGEEEIEPVDSWRKQEDLENQRLENPPVAMPQTILCVFATTKSPTYQNLLINEVAWMGSSKSASDEWIELKNISGLELDVSNWQILDKEEQIKIALPVNTKIKAGEFFLLERTDDSAVPNVRADVIYTGALSNSDEGLRLFDNKCNLIDEVLANSEWPAGEAAARKTMERQSDLSWNTYTGVGEGSGDALILGTPKKENSPKIIYGGGGGSTPNQQPITNDQQSLAKILISEIQITGGTGKSNNDFIELYNPNDSRVNLKGYRLVKRTKTGTTDTGIKSWTNDAYIEAKSFFLWANSEYEEISSVPDITTTATLANDNGVALRFGAEDSGTIIDSVAWGAAENAFIEGSKFPTNPGANESIQRKIQNGTFMDTDNNVADFEIQNCPSPKSQSGYCQVGGSNKALSAFFDFSPTRPKTGEEIIFNAASSTPDDQIVLYEWNFGDLSASSGQATSTTFTATTTHTYSLAGDFSVSLTIFDNLSASSTYTFPLFVASSSVNHILISEIMAGLGSGEADKEFIELYNPTSEDASLTGYSLKRKSSILATTTQNLVKSDDFAGTVIKANSFLLIASKEFQGSSTPDIFYSYTSYHLAYDDDAVVLYDNNGAIIDEVDYENIESGKSFERKALNNGICVSTQSEGEFLGNGCDTGNFSDFEIRDIPNPQNKNNFSEPRSKPAQVSGLTGQYDKLNKKIILAWNTSQDYSGATSTLSYLISDISPDSVLSDIKTSSTMAEFNISEIGRDYVLNIQAFDNEGLSSEVSSVSVFTPNITIEEANYFIVNQTNIAERMDRSVGQVFKPLASGVISSVTMNLYTANYGFSDVNIRLYEWLGDATTTPNLGKGRLLAESGAQNLCASMAAYYPVDLTWQFSGENQIVLDDDKYYFLETNIIPVSGDLILKWAKSDSFSLIDGMAWSGATEINDLYIIVKALSNGTIGLISPIDNHIYEDSNINLEFSFVEPIDNKYNSIVVETKDFYTGEIIGNSVINLTEEQKLIGRHSFVQPLQIAGPGFFKTILAFANCFTSCEVGNDKKEINFSIRGVLPPNGFLLNQTSISGDISARGDFGVAQSFKPAADGQLDSVTLKLATCNGGGWSRTLLKIYEWIGGGLNSASGSKGQLLATSDSKTFTGYSSYPEPSDFSWTFSGDNAINLDKNNYYYLELSIDLTSNDAVPSLYFKGSGNDSLIDGKLYSQYVSEGDLYLIIKAKQ